MWCGGLSGARCAIAMSWASRPGACLRSPIHRRLEKKKNGFANDTLIFFLIPRLKKCSSCDHKSFKLIASFALGVLLELFAVIQKKTGDWARGQLILGLIIAVLSFIGLIFLLPKYALVLALVAGITELVPYIGPILGAIPAVFLGFTVQPFSFGRGLAVLILYIVIQQVENNLLVPQVMKKSVGLNPVVIIIVMLIGARLAGIVGLILAIPVATAIGVIIKDFVKNSALPAIKAELDDDGISK